MIVPTSQLAQVNVSRLLAPLDSELLAPSTAALDVVNAEGDVAPGFVWRLRAEDGDATSVRAFRWDTAGSHGVVVNLTVWQSPEDRVRRLRAHGPTNYAFSLCRLFPAPDARDLEAVDAPDGWLCPA